MPVNLTVSGSSRPQPVYQGLYRGIEIKDQAARVSIPYHALQPEKRRNPRDAHARSLIFDLDTAIQALVDRLGRDDPETVKLTASITT